MGTTLVRCGALIDGSGRGPIRNATLVVDGDPLADIRVLQDQARLQLIMKVGHPFKNTLETQVAQVAQVA